MFFQRHPLYKSMLSSKNSTTTSLFLPCYKGFYSTSIKDRGEKSMAGTQLTSIVFTLPTVPSRPPRAPFSEVAPPRFVSVYRRSVHVTLDTIMEEDGPEFIRDPHTSPMPSPPPQPASPISAPSFSSSTLCFFEAQRTMRIYRQTYQCT